MRAVSTLALLGIGGCLMASETPEMLEELPDRFTSMEFQGEMADADGLGTEGYGRGGGGLSREKAAAPAAAVMADSALLAKVVGTTGGKDLGDDKGAMDPKDAAPNPEASVREWFPEAFLWQPLVETDGDGIASLDVRVPDPLTTWRVLALAHDRGGRQAGTVHRFDSTLPAYIDPVIPGWSFVGDELVLPIQVVNNGADPLSSTFVASTSGALSGSSRGAVDVGPYGSTVFSVPLVVESAGSAALFAELSGVDAVRREWPVSPTGKPVVSQRGGVLTGSRSFSMDWPDGTDARTAQLRVEVHPGPLAVLSSELERLSSGGRAGGAYVYGLAGQLEALSAASGAELDASVVRALKIRAWQRLVREARSPSPGQAADLLIGMGDGDGGALLDSLRDRLVRTLSEGQRADGTWSRESRSTLQRVLVQTAVAMQALPESSSGALIRAEGALERNLPNVDDPYTAAVMLATGRVSNTDILEALVMDGLIEVEGAERRTVKVPQGTQSAWGGPPSHTEMLAWTALALADTEPDVAGDLVAELMTRYSGVRGFGGGHADGLALQAVVRALPTVDSPVRLSLRVNGSEVATGAVDPAQPGVPALLQTGHPGGDAVQIELNATPATAGLSFVVTQQAWVPWEGSQGLPGVEVEVAQGPLRAGREGSIRFTIAAPSGAEVTVVQGLPAGVAVDESKLAAQPGVRSAEVQPDRLEFKTKPFGPGEVLEISARVTPTYAGQLVSRPLEVSVGGRSAMIAPHEWVVRP